MINKIKGFVQMKKIIPLSLITLSLLNASDAELAPINVEATIVTEVAQNAQTSADLAEALSLSVPSVDMNRRSGIANDVYIRGQKRDNISVEVDGTKTCGACINRMDPPVSHILASQIDEVEVTEGPYDVETFGTMSGGIKIKTKQPTQKTIGEINLGFGSWGYKKFGATVSGGNDIVRVLVSGSVEKSGQYVDGNGDDMATQTEKYILAHPSLVGGKMDARYTDGYKDMDAYTKKSIATKAFVTVTQDQELRLSYTGNQSDNVLYPSGKMDALYDNSDIYNVEYNINNLSDIYKNISLQYYKSNVDHPMSTDYRKSAVNSSVMINHLTTQMQGYKFKNTFNINYNKIIVGFDASRRNWDGHYLKDGKPLMGGRDSIDDSTTKNRAIFAKLEKTIGSFDFSAGARHDYTTITNGSNLQSKRYTGTDANLLTTYHIDEQNKVFLGVGQAKRVPDARELYFVASTGSLVGTPDLDQVTNREIDLGYEIADDNFQVKLKTFYSDLQNYIYIKKGVSANAFENIDASVYGAELSASFYPTDEITVDMGASYKRGKKDHALEGQTDTDLADMAPLRGTLGVSYEYMNDSTLSAEVQASDTWDNIDSDNGEKVISSWAIVNLKAKHTINKGIELTVGVNNLFDKTYVINNTYVDLILLTDGITDVMMMNEPGRYIYTNLKFRF